MVYYKNTIGNKGVRLKNNPESLNFTVCIAFFIRMSLSLFMGVFIFASMPLIAQDCTKYMNSPHDVAHRDSFPDGEYNDINKAILNSRTGDVICFRTGIYQGFSIKDIQGGSEKITLRSAPNNEVKIVTKPYKGTGIAIINAKNIVISGFTVTGGLYGIYAKGSSDLVISHNNVSDIGQEAIVIKSGQSKQKLSNFEVSHNNISDTGKGLSQYGEGIYIGDGNNEFNEILAQVRIFNNVISNATNEAIDIKINVKYIDVFNNTLVNTNLKFNGVITVATSNRWGDDAHISIRNNKIKGVKNRSGYRPVGIAIGQGNATIENNEIEEVSENFAGICLYSTFVNPEASTITLKNNNVYTQGQALVKNCGSAGTKSKAFANVILLSDI